MRADDGAPPARAGSGAEGWRYRVASLRSLSARAFASLRRRGLLPTLELAWRRLRPPPRVGSSLQLLGDVSGRPDPVFAYVESPVASVVVRGDARCLHALARDGAGCAFEVVDSPAQARGDYLVFLDPDSEPQPGWLEALLDTFAAFPDTGLAGSMLVTTRGRVCGSGEDPGHPGLSFVREVDSLPRLALASPRALYAQLDGDSLDEVELARRVRALGGEVRHQPFSIVVRAHEEGASPVPVAIPRHPKVLVIDAQVPSPRRDSGSVRMRAILRELRAAGCAVAFVDETGAWAGEDTRALQRDGIEAWWQPWTGGLPRWLREHGPRFDAIVVSRHYVLSPLLPLLRRHAPQAQLVFDTVDLHFLRESREAGHTGDAAAAARAQRTQDSELALVDAVDSSWVVSADERERLLALRPGARVEVVSNIHPLVLETPGFEARRDLVFVGGFVHAPNVDAVLWLAREILPRLRERLPQLQVHVVGAHAPAQVLALDGTPGMRLHGQLDALEPLLDACRVSLAPLRFGAGVKGKVNQAMARGLPVVATHCAAEGMQLRDGEDVLLADEAEAFANAVVRLHEDAALWEKLRAGGYANTQRHFSPEAARTVLLPWLASLGS